MLQQTQTSRVVGPWRAFLEAYPTPSDCANATLASVLQRWAGLGYHRRAKALHDAARMIRDEFHGAVPSDVDALRRLPGVGEYTANAVASFAFGRPVAVLDTNVGRILARALENRSLRPREARDIATALLPRRESASFNQAMLDLGAQFCRSSPRCDDCPVQVVCRWRLEGGPDPAPLSAAVSRPQTPFAGSDRQARGRVLAALRVEPQSETRLLAQLCDVGDQRAAKVLASLLHDGLVNRTGRMIHLSRD
jgi:A/G-specific adenine glycosylase